MIPLAISLLIGIVFWPAVRGEALFDDIGWERLPTRIRAHRPDIYKGWLGDLRLWRAQDGRPLTWWTFQRNFDWFQYSMAGWHLTNFAIHAANVTLAYALLCNWVSPDRAFLAAAVFAVHPLQCQSVAYISGRFGMLSAFFALCALNAFVLGAWWMIPLCLYLGLAAKEDILAVPFLMGVLWLMK